MLTPPGDPPGSALRDWGMTGMLCAVRLADAVPLLIWGLSTRH
jgi:hypothetical protein